MTPTGIVVILVGIGLGAALLALIDIPPAHILVITGILMVIVAAPALGQRMRIRSIAKEFSRQPDGQEAPVKVAFQHSLYTPAIGEVTTPFRGDPTFFCIFPGTSLSRMLWRLGISRRLDIADEAFNREISVAGDRRLGSLLFASAERRDAARAVFRLGFGGIQYSAGVLGISRLGMVSDDVALAVKPHLAVLARSPEEVRGQQFERPGVAPARTSASGARTVQTRLFPVPLIALDAIGTVLLGLGLAKQLAGIDVIPASLRFQRYEIVFIAVGIALMVPVMFLIVRNVTKSVPGRKLEGPADP